MSELTAYHQLGKYIVSFQHVERQINDILCLLAGADVEFVSILINELDYSQRIKTMDVAFARFADLRINVGCSEEKAVFHKVVVELGKLCERRNDLVHSEYYDWHNTEGKPGLLRQNSKLRGKEGQREQSEEKLLPECFNDDIHRVKIAYGRLEEFRLKIIDWVYPDENA